MVTVLYELGCEKTGGCVLRWIVAGAIHCGYACMHHYGCHSLVIQNRFKGYGSAWRDPDYL